MSQNSGKQILYGAAILGGAILIGSILIANELNRVNSRLDDVSQDLADARGAIDKLQQARPPAAPRRARGPDPNRRYTVNTSGSPAIGPATAPVKIVEFSDFQ
ncbi:MAG: hypothetical protein V3U86_05795 [Acidobacteriota bacterium]|nr:hypothetical protein [Acidobacteriota bacterium]